MTASCAAAHWMLVVRVGVVAWLLFCLHSQEALKRSCRNWRAVHAKIMEIKE